ncbi:MAG TPA: amidohydrolase family protein [Chloroflexota bacterium]|nr:amidohydrolase family protein [Chloroflexota bacterium]
MPNFPIVDAHLHLWDPRHFRMSWLDPIPPLNQPFGLAEYRRHTVGVEIAAMVYLEVDVEKPYALLEARWAVERAGEDSRLQGIVPWAPLEYGERARAYLAELRAISPLIKGVRRIVQGEPERDFYLQPDFVTGVRLLPEYDLSFDLCIRADQLPSTVSLARRCPETQFILDHCGKPAVGARVLDPWRRDLAALAALPNVYCKVSGLVTEADHQHWTAEDLAPYVDHVLAVFGEDRVVFGGDWPVATLASTYPRWVETLDRLTARLGDVAQRKLWAENARRFYRLPASD